MWTSRKQSSRLKSGIGFAALGAVIAIALLAYDYLYLTGPDGFNHATELDVDLFMALCPPSFGLMALEHASSTTLLFSLSFIVLLNAGLYGSVGWVAGAIADKLRGSPN
jgi:hypothetical protein